MPAGLSDVIVVNSALEHIAQQKQILALDDGSAAAKLATVVYAPLTQLLLRELDPDFARFTVALQSAGATTPMIPWGFEYAYPPDCLRLRQVRPPLIGAGALPDPFDPQPIRANVAFDQLGSPPVQTKVILTNQANALAVYTTNLVTEGQWDSVFTDAMVRRLANALSMGLAGRPDFAKEILETSAQMAQTAEIVDEGGFRR